MLFQPFAFLVPMECYLCGDHGATAAIVRGGRQLPVCPIHGARIEAVLNHAGSHQDHSRGAGRMD